METITHNLSKQKMQFLKKGEVVSTLYILDENGNKIPDGLNAKGELTYQRAVCLNKNLE